MEVVRGIHPIIRAGNLLSLCLGRNQDRPVLLMLSGGSALSVLEHVREETLGAHVTISALDERFSDRAAVNNFAQIASTAFFARASERGVSAIDTRPQQGETLAMLGSRFERALRAWRASNPEGAIIVLMGIGNDGHTAGMFAYDTAPDFTGRAWVCAYELPPGLNPYPARITVTHTFLLDEVAAAVVYAVGDEKRHIIRSLSASVCDRTTMPACVIREMRECVVSTDSR